MRIRSLSAELTDTLNESNFSQRLILSGLDSKVEQRYAASLVIDGSFLSNIYFKI